MTLATLLMIVAVVLFVCAALGVTSPKVNLGWLGLAVWALATLVGNVAIT